MHGNSSCHYAIHTSYVLFPHLLKHGNSSCSFLIIYAIHAYFSSIHAWELIMQISHFSCLSYMFTFIMSFFPHLACSYHNNMKIINMLNVTCLLSIISSMLLFSCYSRVQFDTYIHCHFILSFKDSCIFIIHRQCITSNLANSTQTHSMLHFRLTMRLYLVRDIRVIPHFI